jgi:hypothetical protein
MQHFRAWPCTATEIQYMVHFVLAPLIHFSSKPHKYENGVHNMSTKLHKDKNSECQILSEADDTVQKKMAFYGTSHNFHTHTQ